MSIHIAITGNPADGFAFSGPFDDRDFAFEVADETFKNSDIFIAELDTHHTQMWSNPLIQFARLVCEIQATVDFGEDGWMDLRDSMGLGSSELYELFERASEIWEEAKQAPSL